MQEQTIQIEQYSPHQTIGDIQKLYGTSYDLQRYFDQERGLVRVWELQFDIKKTKWTIRYEADRLNCAIVNVAHFGKIVQEMRADEEFQPDIEDVVTRRNNQSGYKSKAKKKLNEAIARRALLLKFAKRVGMVVEY